MMTSCELACGMRGQLKASPEENVWRFSTVSTFGAVVNDKGSRLLRVLSMLAQTDGTSGCVSVLFQLAFKSDTKTSLCQTTHSLRPRQAIATLVAKTTGKPHMAP